MCYLHACTCYLLGSATNLNAEHQSLPYQCPHRFAERGVAQGHAAVPYSLPSNCHMVQQWPCTTCSLHLSPMSCTTWYMVLCTVRNTPHADRPRLFGAAVATQHAHTSWYSSSNTRRQARMLHDHFIGLIMLQAMCACLSMPNPSKDCNNSTTSTCRWLCVAASLMVLGMAKPTAQFVCMLLSNSRCYDHATHVPYACMPLASISCPALSSWYAFAAHAGFDSLRLAF